MSLLELYKLPRFYLSGGMLGVPNTYSSLLRPGNNSACPPPQNAPVSAYVGTDINSGPFVIDVQPVVTPLIGGGVFVQTGGLMQCLGGICPSFFGSEEETEPIKPRSPRTRGEVNKASRKAGYDIRDSRIRHINEKSHQMHRDAMEKRRQYYEKEKKELDARRRRQYI